MAAIFLAGTIGALVFSRAALGESMNIFSKDDPPTSVSQNLCPIVPFPTFYKHQTCAAPKAFYALPGDYAPWTSRPMCVDTNLTTDLANPQDKETFCIYTKKDFGDGRGIAFFTSTKIIAEVLKMSAFTDPKSIKGMNDLIGGKFGPPPYEFRRFPVKGLGLVANRTIYRGERIMQETPTYVYNRNVFTSTDEESRIPMGWHAAYQLPEEARHELLALHKHHGGDEIDDLMRTNAFGAYYADFDLHNNVLPRISRFNHDCRPK
jgi:hypothetical protein